MQSFVFESIVSPAFWSLLIIVPSMGDLIVKSSRLSYWLSRESCASLTLSAAALTEFLTLELSSAIIVEPLETLVPSSATILETSPLTSAYTALFSLYVNVPLDVEALEPTSAVAIWLSEMAPGFVTFILTFLTIVLPVPTFVAPLISATLPLSVSNEP